MEPLVIFSISMMLALLGASALRYQARGDSQFAMRQSLLVAIFNALLLPNKLALAVYGFFAFAWWMTPVIFLAASFLVPIVIRPRNARSWQLNYSMTRHNYTHFVNIPCNQ